MATCGDCELFQGASTKCDAGRGGLTSNRNACSDSFKGPASLFDGKKCGGCRLFAGINTKCGAGMGGLTSNRNACSDSYVPIAG